MRSGIFCGAISASLENIKKLLLGIKPMTISTIPSIIFKPRGKVAVFHDALRYLASLIEVKSTLHQKLHVFFIVEHLSSFKKIPRFVRRAREHGVLLPNMKNNVNGARVFRYTNKNGSILTRVLINIKGNNM